MSNWLQGLCRKKVRPATATPTSTARFFTDHDATLARNSCTITTTSPTRRHRLRPHTGSPLGTDLGPTGCASSTPAVPPHRDQRQIPAFGILPPPRCSFRTPEGARLLGIAPGRRNALPDQGLTAPRRRECRTFPSEWKTSARAWWGSTRIGQLKCGGTRASPPALGQSAEGFAWA